jgi:ankyrin repeat protein
MQQIKFNPFVILFWFFCGLAMLPALAADTDADKLYKAVQMDDVVTVKNMLSEGVDVNAKTTDGTYAINMASIRGNTEIIELLLTKGADINVQNDSQGDSPLHCVVKFQGAPTSAQLLVAAGADTTLVDHQDKTALDYATEKYSHWEAMVSAIKEKAE